MSDDMPPATPPICSVCGAVITGLADKAMPFEPTTREARDANFALTCPHCGTRTFYRFLLDNQGNRIAR